MARITSSLQQPGVLSALVTRARLAFRLLREPRVPLLAKVVPILGAVYLVSPLDAVPDIIPVLGQLDDLGFVVFALEMFLRLCPAAAVAFHRAALSGGRRYGPMPQAEEDLSGPPFTRSTFGRPRASGPPSAGRR